MSKDLIYDLILILIGMAIGAEFMGVWIDRERHPECPEDSVLFWEGTTNDHTACIAVDDLWEIQSAPRNP